MWMEATEDYVAARSKGLDYTATQMNLKNITLRKNRREQRDFDSTI